VVRSHAFITSFIDGMLCAFKDLRCQVRGRYFEKAQTEEGVSSYERLTVSVQDWSKLKTYWLEPFEDYFKA
jgi:hypothetical protein